MTTTPDAPILLRNTMRITPGHLAGFRDAVTKAVKFAEENGPQLLVEVFIDEENLLAYSFQLYAGSAAIQRHWHLSDPYIREVMEHRAVDRLEVYGEPNAAVTEGLHPPNGSEAPVAITPRLTGFVRQAYQ